MNQIIQALEFYPSILITVTLIFGLLVGSFLNVVIFRYPIMLFREWENMAKDMLTERGFQITAPEKPVDNYPANFNLVTPRSACPKCDHKISALENIPILSYLFLRGRCRNCATPISIRYPLIELLTGLCFAACAYQFGYGWPLVISLVITAYFIAMSFIDIDHQYLPDTMTLPLVWLAIIAAMQPLYVSLNDALIGAIAGYLSLWSVYWVYKLLTGKEGMGHGDFKLLAVIGALVGWQKLGLVIILSAGVGAIIGGTLLLIQAKGMQTRIPFGPYLVVAGWCTFLWGEPMMQVYLNLIGVA
ncbi:prepilin peptidase [Aliikangiella maris]|uniref:A24 family peptidase n=2 Tax=Aliikangiella maris TaxID=3162458 RepID=A0ABV3MMJ4_9GAMM